MANDSHTAESLADVLEKDYKDTLTAGGKLYLSPHEWRLVVSALRSEIATRNDVLEQAIQRCARWLHKGAPIDECESNIRDVANLAGRLAQPSDAAPQESPAATQTSKPTDGRPASMSTLTPKGARVCGSFIMVGTLCQDCPTPENCKLLHDAYEAQRAEEKTPPAESASPCVVVPTSLLMRLSMRWHEIEDGGGTLSNVEDEIWAEITALLAAAPSAVPAEAMRSTATTGETPRTDEAFPPLVYENAERDGWAHAIDLARQLERELAIERHSSGVMIDALEDEIEKLKASPSATRLTDWLRDNAPDCGDNSCLFGGRGKGGMRTNGGCRCYRDVRPDMKRIFIERMWTALSLPTERGESNG